MAACYAVENSLGYEADPSTKARLLRNVVLGFEFLMSHILHFYALAALDFIQGPGSGPTPPGTGNSPLPKQSGPWSPYYNDAYYLVPYLIEAQNNLLNGANHTIWGDIILDYVLALQMQRRAAEVQGIFGARWPMFSNLVCGGVTHPYLDDKLSEAIALAEGILFKGILSEPDFEGGTVTTLGDTTTPAQGTLLHFIRKHYIPDVMAVAAIYSNYDNDQNHGLQLTDGKFDLATGEDGQKMGAGCKNFVSYGVFHDGSQDAGDKKTHPNHLLKAGITIGNSLYRSEEPMTIVKKDVKEFIDHSWYDDDGNYAAGLAPHEGYTKPNRDNGAYSWIKAPRIKSDTGSTGYTPIPGGPYAAEVGPLARMINSNLYNVGLTWQGGAVNGNDEISVLQFGGACINRPAIGNAAGSLANILWLGGGTFNCTNPQKFGISTMDRHRARVLEALTIANALAGCKDGTAWEWSGTADKGWLFELGNTTGSSVNKTWAPPQSGTAEGWGTNEAPRGALLHYNKYSENRITKYQCVVPTTWNCSPAGGKMGDNPVKGPVEQAIESPALFLSGYKSASGRDALKTEAKAQYVAVEALRVVHSFDPCIACAVHKVDGKKVKAKRLDIKKEVSRR